MKLKIILLVTELVVLRERGPCDGQYHDLLILSFSLIREHFKCDLEENSLLSGLMVGISSNE